ncbi:ribonuclease HII [Anaerosolibacter carboniphilus]|uniref:Ribonuclease HII n=1 Tax=Anaerosolibacter carboniphilus TaxID=1417629 RepID=A0A841L670_9FIRM|nr:ribonuclease HII [Anaerosolibacter carboniphilus]MBB6217795.1 ribonuclease HII [Anaerosolibacter carboniphilus]
MNFEGKSAKEIEKLIKMMDIEAGAKLIPFLLKDERTSIRKLGEGLAKKLEKFIQEKERVRKLWYYENEIFKSGVKLIAGIDEAGRGPLAGPVVAAAVILPKGIFIEGIDDSKKLSEAKRDILFDIIRDKALSIGVGIVDNHIIDEINIFNATKLAMSNAIENLSICPEYLLIDAVKLTDIHIKQQALIKGDSKSISIAAASIIAKVTRDRMIKEYDVLYPQYGFRNHKGYGTKEHYESIEKHGITNIHRKTFLKGIVGEYQGENHNFK